MSWTAAAEASVPIHICAIAAQNRSATNVIIIILHFGSPVCLKGKTSHLRWFHPLLLHEMNGGRGRAQFGTLSQTREPTGMMIM